MGTAIQAIYRDLEYAKTLIKHRIVNPDHEVGDEESWTFIGDEGGDPEPMRRIPAWEPVTHIGEGVKSSAVPNEVGGGIVPLEMRFPRRKSQEKVPNV